MKLRDLTYSEAMELGAIQDVIKSIMKSFYSDVTGYTGRGNQITKKGEKIISNISLVNNDIVLNNELYKYQLMLIKLSK